MINGTEIKSLLDMGMVNKGTGMTEVLRLDDGRHYQFLFRHELSTRAQILAIAGFI